MRLVSLRFFLRSRLEPECRLAAVERNVIFVDDHSSVVNVRHISDADVGHRAVVEERAAAPLAADKADAAITEAVINTAVETDMRAPISGVPR